MRQQRFFAFHTKKIMLLRTRKKVSSPGEKRKYFHIEDTFAKSEKDNFTKKDTFKMTKTGDTFTKWKHTFGNKNNENTK